MNTSQIIIAICAIAGFIISLINLGIIVYNNFIKKAKIQVEVKDFYTRFRDFGIYDFQLDCIIHAKKGNVRLRDIRLCNHSAFTTKNLYNESNVQPLYKAIDGKRFDITSTSTSLNTFEKEVEELFKDTSFRILDVKIENNDFKYLSFIGQIHTIRYSDGFDELPKENWFVEIEYNDSRQKRIHLSHKIIGKEAGVYRHY